MSANSSEIIYPCPVSKGYGIPAQQAWNLLKVFVFYRLILGGLFVTLLYNSSHLSSLDSYKDYLYAYGSQSYLALSIMSAICLFWRLTDYSTQAQWLIFTDIIILSLLMHACGGVKCGIGILLAVSIASGGLLIGGRCAMLFAALASLAVLTEQIYSSSDGNYDPASFTYAGMLGAAFFTTALLSYILAKRSEEASQLVSQQKQTIVKLEELNHYIIQHLQSGIIIADKAQTVHTVNEASIRLIHLAASPKKLSDISEHLSHAFEAWLTNFKRDFVLLKFPNQSEIHCRFMVLPTSQQTFYMIIFEDIALYSQRLQQSKLASLGRLTASIAHEIRNPLSAITHASQLLAESPSLTSQDQRLTKIIETHAGRVNFIIEDILQLSRRTDSRREKIPLKNWLNDYLKNFMLLNTVHEDQFSLLTTSQSLTALIDPGHLRQIMDNLCQNALKYGKPELGQIVVHVRSYQNSPCIEVIDNGSGISQEHLKNLFEPFFTTSPTGTGLGLYISRELAELNQANLSYLLLDDSRSCFRLCLQDAERNQIEI